MAQMITRCPGCGTRFRVVADQLRISQGWVRCGNCEEIFDASQSLGDDGDAPAAPSSDMPSVQPAHAARQEDLPATDQAASAAQAAALATQPAPVASTHAETGPWLAPGASEMPVTDPAAALDQDLAAFVQAQSVLAQDTQAGPPAPQGWTPGLQRASREPVADAAAAGVERLYVPLPAESNPASRGLAARADVRADAMPLPLRPAAQVSAAPAVVAPRVVAAQAVVPAAPLDPAHAELRFMREAVAVVPAEHGAALRRARALWAGMGVLALLVLLWQLAVHERDRLASSAPGLRPLLDLACAPLGCRVQALRRIDAIVIDGSSFQSLGERSYRLSLTLRNRAAHAVALPAVALSLTDIAEQPVLRRVLLPADFGAHPEALQPHGEWATSLDLQVAENAGAARVVGYRIDPFYP